MFDVNLIDLNEQINIHCLLTNLSSIKKTPLSTDYTNGFSALLLLNFLLWGWRDHLIRNVNQDLYTRNILQNLKSLEVLIIADWAMKYLPQTFRETQSEWFGKQGISWHMICAVICRPHSDDIDNNNKFDIISMVHLVQEGNQGWHLVSQIFGDAFQTKRISLHPHLMDAYIRSDNAGCYHALPILSYHGNSVMSYHYL